MKRQKTEKATRLPATSPKECTCYQVQPDDTTESSLPYYAYYAGLGLMLLYGAVIFLRDQGLLLI